MNLNEQAIKNLSKQIVEDLFGTRAAKPLKEHKGPSKPPATRHPEAGLTEQERDKIRSIIPFCGSHEDFKEMILEELEEKHGEAVKIIATYPERVLFESQGKHFEAGYCIDGELVVLNEAIEVEPRFYPKETATLIEEELGKRDTAWIFEQKVAGTYKEPPVKVKPLDESKFTQEDHRNRRIAGLE